MGGLVLGLDVGGSKTHAVLADGDTVLADVLAGSANPSSVGVKEASRQLDAIVAQLRGHGPVAAVCAGAAGVDTSEGEERFRRLLADGAPAAEITVVHDSALILAAAGASTGIAVISGTGSVGWGRDRDGRVARMGGWGYLLGDEGSGYWVSRTAVQHALRRADDGAPADLLSQQLAADCGLKRIDQLLDHFYANPERRYWASRARIVFELAGQHDPASAAIVAAAADALASLAIRVGTTLDLHGPVVLAGGLAVHQPALQQAVQDRLSSAGMTDVRVLDRDPVYGAVNLAQALLCPPDEARSTAGAR
jgi:glucosamine kinase